MWDIGKKVVFTWSDGKKSVYQVIANDLNGNPIIQRDDGGRPALSAQNKAHYKPYVEPKPEPPLTDKQLAYVLEEIKSAWSHPSFGFRDQLDKRINQLLNKN